MWSAVPSIAHKEMVHKVGAEGKEEVVPDKEQAMVAEGIEGVKKSLGQEEQQEVPRKN